MCNLYSLTKGQAAIRDWFRAPYDRTGNLPLFPAIFPDQLAPIIRRGRMVSASLSWRAGACLDRRSSRRADYEHSQRWERALARMARQAKPLYRSGDIVLRIRRHQAP
jgi:hypothetical protein